MPHFSLLILKTENEPKMNMFDFGAFRKKMHMLSHDKILLHILFGAFQVTPRTFTWALKRLFMLVSSVLSKINHMNKNAFYEKQTVFFLYFKMNLIS